MGLAIFPVNAFEGAVPVLVMQMVLWAARLVRYVNNLVFQVRGVDSYPANSEELSADTELCGVENEKQRGVSISRYTCLLSSERNGDSSDEIVECCCVCLCQFEEDEEVSELLNCKHYFHKDCLEKWFHSQSNSCPLCRSKH